MTDAQRVDVERLRPVSVFEVQPSLPSMEPHPFGAYVRHSDYAALLLQVAELEAARDHYKQLWGTAAEQQEAAERAREEAKKVWFPILGTPFAIRRDALNEEQAKQNHGQTLDRLAQRGGLSPDEALAVAERRPFRSVAYQQAFAAFLAANGGGRED